MKPMSLRGIRHSVGRVIAAVALAGCGSEGAFGPEDGASNVAFPVAAAAARSVDLGTCQQLRAPQGSQLAFHTYADGVQIYRWNGQAWVFGGPSATLYANAGGTGVVGSHYGGPTWKLNSGGFVVGALSKRCDVDPADIPWLLLDVVRNEGPGVFRGVTHIQRVNTVGGQVPAVNGSFTGEVRNVPYTAEYFFYRAP